MDEKLYLLFSKKDDFRITKNYKLLTAKVSEVKLLNRISPEL